MANINDELNKSTKELESFSNDAKKAADASKELNQQLDNLNNSSDEISKDLENAIKSLDKYLDLLNTTKEFNIDNFSKVFYDINIDDKIKEVNKLKNEMLSLEDSSKAIDIFSNFDKDIQEFKNQLYQINSDTIMPSDRKEYFEVENIRDSLNESKQLADQFASVKLESDKLLSFDWNYIPMNLEGDTERINKLKDVIIDLNKQYNSLQESFRNITEFGQFRGANELFEGFKVEQSDASENVLDNKDIIGDFESQGFNKNVIEYYNKIKNGYNNALEKGNFDTVSKIDEEISKKSGGWDFSSVEVFVNAQNSINRFNSYIGKDIKGINQLLSITNDTVKDINKNANILLNIENIFNKDTIDKLFKTGQLSIRDLEKEQEQVDLGEFDFSKNKTEITKNNKEIDESIKKSEQFKNALKEENEQLNNKLKSLELIKDINKSEIINRDLGNSAQYNLYQRDIEQIGKASNAVYSLKQNLKDQLNKNLINRNIGIDTFNIGDIENVLSKDYKSGFSTEDKENIEQIRSDYNEILKLKEQILNYSKSQEFIDQLENKVAKDIENENNKIAEAKEKISKNNLQETYTQKGIQIKEIENAINYLNEYADKIKQVKKLELQKEAESLGINLNASNKDKSNKNQAEYIKRKQFEERINKNLSNIDEQFGINKLKDIKRNLSQELEDISAIYRKAGVKLDHSIPSTSKMAPIDSGVKYRIFKETRNTEQYKEEEKILSNLKNKLDEYNNAIKKSDASGITRLNEKLQVYVDIINTAIKKHNVLKAQKAFSVYETQFNRLNSFISNTENKLDVLKNKIKEALSNKDTSGARSIFEDYTKELNKISGTDAYSERLNEVKKLKDEIAKVENEIARETQSKAQESLNKITGIVREVVTNIKQGIANLIKIIRSANKIVNSFLKGIISFSGLIVTGIEKIIQVFGNLGNRVKDSGKQVNIFRNTFTELNSAIQLVRGAINSVFNNEFINQAEKLYSTIQSLNVMIGTNATKSTIEWADSLERALGISASDLLSNLREVSSVMYGLGMTAKDVDLASRNLEVVGLKLSAITGMDYNTVMDKIQSGMKGMTQSVDDLGISVRSSQMDVFLKKINAEGANLGSSFENLSEQERVYVRYAAIVDQVMSKQAYSAGNFNAVMHSVTGQLNILRSQFNQLKATIGLFGLALIKNLIMPVTYVVYVINQLIQQIAKLLGFSLDLNDVLGEAPNIEIGDGVEDLTNDLEDNAEAAEKAKGALDAWDHVSTMSTSKNKGATGAFDPSSLIGDIPDLGDELTKFTDDYIEQCKKKFDELIQYIKDKIMNTTSDLVKSLTGRSIDWSFISNNLKTVVDNIKKTFINLFNTIKNIAKIAFTTIWSVGDDLDFSLLLAKLTGLVERITKLMAVVTEKIQKPIQDMYDKYISKYVVRLGDFIEKQLDKLTAKFNDWIKWWEDPKNTGAINNFFDNLGQNIEKVIVAIVTLFNGYSGLNKEDNKVADSATGGWKGLILVADSVHNVFSNIKDILVDIGTQLGWINANGTSNFENIGKSIGNAFEGITNTINNVITTLSTLIFGYDNLDDKQKETVSNMGTGWSSIINIANTLHDIIGQVFTNLTGISDIESAGAAISGVFSTISENLKQFSEYLIENKESIIEVLTSIGQLGKDLAEAKFEFIKTIVKTIVDNSSVISFVCEQVGNIIKLAAEHPVLTMTFAVVLPAVLQTALKIGFWNMLMTGAGGAGIGASISAMLAPIGEAISGIGAAIAAIGAGPIAIIVAAIAAVGVALATAEAKFKSISGLVDIFTNGPLATLKEGFDTLVGSIGKVVDIFKQMFTGESSGQFETLTTIIGTLGSVIGIGLYNSISMVVTILGSLLKILGNVIQDVGMFIASITKMIGGLFTLLEGIVTGNGEKITQGLTDIFDGFSAAILSVISTFIHVIGGLFETILGVIFNGIKSVGIAIGDGFVQGVNEKWEGVKEFFNNIFTNLVDTIKNLLGVHSPSTVFEAIGKNLVDGLRLGVENAWKTLRNNFNTLITNLKTNISNKLSNVKYIGANFINSIKSGIASAWSGLKQSITDKFDWIKQKASGIANKFSSTISNATSRISSGGVTSVRGVTTRASGGAIKSGSLALINENGNSEILGNFGGYTGVANNNMIIEAMQSALLQAFKQANIGNNGGNIINNIEISKGGIFAGDDSAIRNLANRLNAISNNSNRTIANKTFSMT